MTRAHARLLGPCFKTGPESTQIYSVVDRRFKTRSVREHRNQQSFRDRIGTRSDRRQTRNVLATGRTLTNVAAPRHIYTVERVCRNIEGPHKIEKSRGLHPES